MADFNKVHEIMQQEVSRKEFLRYAGVALLGLIGITNMLQSLHKSLSPGSLNEKPKRAGSGYGMSAYGR